MSGEFPPPGFWRDPLTGKQWALTKADEREVNRLFAKHRDIARGEPVEQPPPRPVLVAVNGGPPQGRRCHLCQAALGDDDYIHGNGLDWCRDALECKFRARLRLGVGYARALRAKAAEQYAEGDRTMSRAERMAATPPPVPDADYIAYIRSSVWEKFANEQRLLAIYHCEWCSSLAFDLDVHHMHYRTFGHEQPEDVLVVCPLICHPELDAIRKAGKLPPVEIRLVPGPPPRRIVTRTDQTNADDRRQEGARQ